MGGVVQQSTTALGLWLSATDRVRDPYELGDLTSLLA